MQAIYFPSRMLHLKKDEEFIVECNHDEYSLWFDVHSSGYQPETKKSAERSLGLTLISRNRLSQLNDSNRNNMLIRLMKKVYFYFIYFRRFIF